MCCTIPKVLVFAHRSKRNPAAKSKEQKLSSCIQMCEGHGTGTRTHRRRPACAQVIVQYLTHLQQENNCYSICTRQISKAVQFIKANYWYKMLEVISTRHILHSFRHRPSALLLWIEVLPAQWPHSAARNWVVRLFDTAQRNQGPRL